MSKFEIFNNISEKAVSLPFLMSGSLKALVRGLLIKDDKKRFDFEQVSKSKWLKEVSFVYICFFLLLVFVAQVPHPILW